MATLSASLADSQWMKHPSNSNTRDLTENTLSYFSTIDFLNQSILYIKADEVKTILPFFILTHDPSMTLTLPLQLTSIHMIVLGQLNS